MDFIITLVAADKPLSAGHLAVVMEYGVDVGLMSGAAAPVWLEPHKAADISLTQKPNAAQIRTLRLMLAADRIDLFVTAADGRRKKLLLADMDSTIITGETLDELAGEAGPDLKDKIAALTERAMRGEIDFITTLRERVMLLKDLPSAALQKTLDAVAFNPGAQTLVRTMAAHGARCVLVSGGFKFFTGAVAAQAGFHAHHGNDLDIADNKLTGKVLDPILDKEAKLAYLHQYTNDAGITLAETMAIGDGSNDLPMLAAAGLGVGYHPKPLLRDTLDNCILYGDLTAALYAQGYKKADFR